MDIAAKLRDFENEGITSSDRFHLRNDAADEIERLRAALKPFVEIDPIDYGEVEYICGSHDLLLVRYDSRSPTGLVLAFEEL